MVFTASLLGAQHIRNSVENKALNGMPPSLCGRQMVGPSSVPVVVAQSDTQDTQTEHELIRVNELFELKYSQ